MIEKVIEEFNKYTDEYDKSIKQINLKYNHSFSVMDLMGELAFRLDLDKEKIELARVIGLLHDIGRFPQFMKYNSFSKLFRWLFVIFLISFYLFPIRNRKVHDFYLQFHILFCIFHKEYL